MGVSNVFRSDIVKCFIDKHCFIVLDYTLDGKQTKFLNLRENGVSNSALICSFVSRSIFAKEDEPQISQVKEGYNPGRIIFGHEWGHIRTVVAIEKFLKRQSRSLIRVCLRCSHEETCNRFLFKICPINILIRLFQRAGWSLAAHMWFQ